MPRTITIKLTGLAEKFIQEMEMQGLNEADVIAQGIGILEEIWRTNRVALVKENFKINSSRTNEDEKILERYYYIQTPDMMRRQNTGSTHYGSSSTPTVEGIGPISDIPLT